MRAMRAFHAHLHVRDLEKSITFYSALFGAKPTRVKQGYAKWMLEDPKVNFAISTGQPVGVSHLGFQVDSDEELADASARAKAAAGTVLAEKGARCCYATGNKTWAEDPQGVIWETFHTTGEFDEASTGADETFRDDVQIANVSGCGCSTKRTPAAISVCCAP
jgi:predicted enzyme related to lactoylglutathione lyase